MMVHAIRIFLSSPADVLEEQEAVRALVSEINDVITFLSPHLDVRVEVVRYQDNTYPDMGKPQDVVNRQIPQNYDIHLGIMWMRCGTPTDTQPSGTIHEFRQAMARREETGKPIIMFYFSEEGPPVMPSTIEDIEQLKGVIKFREELLTMGLTMTYPSRRLFRERVRIGLLRAVADVVKMNEEPSKPRGKRIEEQNQPSTGALRKLAQAYDNLRKEMPSGSDRTGKMASIFSSMCSEAPSEKMQLPYLAASAVAGERLAAIAILYVFPDQEYLSWLADRLNPEVETPFVGFRAGSALLQAVRSLPLSADNILVESVNKALELARRNPNDPPRMKILNQAKHELKGRQRLADGDGDPYHG